MLNNHSKVMALLTAASLLVITALVILSYQLGLFGSTAQEPTRIRKNHSEIRVMNNVRP